MNKNNFGCQQLLLQDPEAYPFAEFICSTANNLSNSGTYLARQIFFHTGKILSKFDLHRVMRDNINFKYLHSQAAQQVLTSVGESFASFRELRKLHLEGKLDQKPKAPGYRKSGGMVPIAYPKQALKLIDGRVRLPLGKTVKAIFKEQFFFVPFPPNLRWDRLREVRFLPRNGCIYVEYVYRVDAVLAQLNPANVLGLDPGVNNWLTGVSNIGLSFILDGLKIKSQNQWFNKTVASLKEGKPQGFWSDQLAQLTERRNRQMRDNVNKAARFVVNWCLNHNVGRIVFGWNEGIKDSINLGRKNNQTFVQIPTAKLRDRIAQLCAQYGIEFVVTEESYTSKASFLDADVLPTYGEKPERWQPSGKRVKRGMYRTGSNQLINADANGAANILRKVSIQLGVNLAEVCRAVLTLPQRYDLDTLSRSYREKSEATRLQAVA